MLTNADNPCQDFEPGSPAFYQALLANYRQAWECLYLSAFRSFVPYARQRSSISADDALDLLQDGMAEFALKLQNGKYAFQGKPVAAYVFTVCRNRWVSFLRKNHLHKVEFVPDAAEEEDDLLADTGKGMNPFRSVLQDDFEEDSTTTERDAIWEDSDVDWEAVSRAYAEVSEDCRTMLHCFYVEEKSLGECGARIGLQENSAKVKRFRCAQRLRSLYLQYQQA